MRIVGPPRVLFQVRLGDAGRGIEAGKEGEHSVQMTRLARDDDTAVARIRQDLSQRDVGRDRGLDVAEQGVPRERELVDDFVRGIHLGGECLAVGTGRDLRLDWLGEVHLAAARHGLVLETGEYRLQHPPGARLARYELELPLKGTYPQLRAFLADVLKKIPAAAVDDVVIRRETVASPQLDAKVRLFVYLGGGS